jgi:hypothetical protein
MPSSFEVFPSVAFRKQVAKAIDSALRTFPSLRVLRIFSPNLSQLFFLKLCGLSELCVRFFDVFPQPLREVVLRFLAPFAWGFFRGIFAPFA